MKSEIEILNHFLIYIFFVFAVFKGLSTSILFELIKDGSIKDFASQTMIGNLLVDLRLERIGGAVSFGFLFAFPETIGFLIVYFSATLVYDMIYLGNYEHGATFYLAQGNNLVVKLYLVFSVFNSVLSFFNYHKDKIQENSDQN